MSCADPAGVRSSSLGGLPCPRGVDPAGRSPPGVSPAWHQAATTSAGHRQGLTSGPRCCPVLNSPLHQALGSSILNSHSLRPRSSFCPAGGPSQAVLCHGCWHRHESAPQQGVASPASGSSGLSDVSFRVLTRSLRPGASRAQTAASPPARVQLSRGTGCRGSSPGHPAPLPLPPTECPRPGARQLGPLGVSSTPAPLGLVCESFLQPGLCEGPTGGPCDVAPLDRHVACGRKGPGALPVSQEDTAEPGGAGQDGEGSPATGRGGGTSVSSLHPA